MPARAEQCPSHSGHLVRHRHTSFIHPDTHNELSNPHTRGIRSRAPFGKKPKRMFSLAFADLPSPPQRLDFLLAITHAYQAWSPKRLR